jgi:hypothetical protein
MRALADTQKSFRYSTLTFEVERGHDNEECDFPPLFKKFAARWSVLWKRATHLPNKALDEKASLSVSIFRSLRVWRQSPSRHHHR